MERLRDILWREGYEAGRKDAMKDALKKVRIARRIRHLYDSQRFMHYVATDGTVYPATQAGYKKAWEHESELVDREKRGKQ